MFYFHHLASFYSNSLDDSQKAVDRALPDLRSRHSIQTYDVLVCEPFANVGRLARHGTHLEGACHPPAGMTSMSNGITDGVTKLQEALAANPN